MEDWAMSNDTRSHPMTAETIHSCSYSCDRPECIRAQRDELAARLTAAQSQPAEGEEIMVNTPYDVFILPLQPSGLSSGPRFVVHVPGQPASPQRRPYNTSGSLSEYGIFPECDAALAAQPGGSDNDR